MTHLYNPTSFIYIFCLIGSIFWGGCDLLQEDQQNNSTQNTSIKADMPARKNFREQDMQYQGKSLRFTRHGRCRSECRQIDPYEIQQILNMGIVNESKSKRNDKPCPSIVYEGRTIDGQQVRIVVGACKGDYRIITVIDLKNKWQCDCE